MLQKQNKIFKAKNTIHGGKWIKGIFKRIDKENPLISIITVTLNSFSIFFSIPIIQKIYFIR